MATQKVSYGTATASTGGLTSLATSSTWVAGYEWFVIDNTTDLALDYEVEGKIRVGTTPAVNTEIRIYLVASYDGGTTWPDVIDGTPSAETWTSAGVRDGCAVLAKSLAVDATTTDRDYYYRFSVAAPFGGFVPPKVSVFVAHNCTAALNATASTHTYAYRPILETST
jgi:hypothetical protein